MHTMVIAKNKQEAVLVNKRETATDAQVITTVAVATMMIKVSTCIKAEELVPAVISSVKQKHSKATILTAEVPVRCIIFSINSIVIVGMTPDYHLSRHITSLLLD